MREVSSKSDPVAETAAFIWERVREYYDLDGGQITPYYWIHDALKLAAAGRDPRDAIPDHLWEEHGGRRKEVHCEHGVIHGRPCVECPGTLSGLKLTSKPGGYVDVGCHAARDGECFWEHCPQLLDGEPIKSGRHCPIDRGGTADE